MSASVVILGLACAALALGAGVLLWDRSRLRAHGAGAQAAAQGARERIAELAGALESSERESDALRERLVSSAADGAALRARLDEQARRHEHELHESRARLEELNDRFQKAFDAAASRALQQSSEHFLRLARESFAKEHASAIRQMDDRVKPIDDALKKAADQIGRIEKERAESFGRLAESSTLLRQETANLVNALKRPEVRGAYGEMSLKRIAELAGMVEHCDFDLQHSLRNEQGRALRPDMIVRLPNGRVVAVDAKTPTSAYIDAANAPDPDDRHRHLDRFARHVFDQVQALSKKEYGDQIAGGLDFVVMFIPGDQFIDAAMGRRPDLLDAAASLGVVIASPSSLIALLRAVHIGWREKRLSDHAQELMTLGRELHERASGVLEAVAEVGVAINRTRDRYNKLVGSVDARLVPTLRKFEEHGAKSSRELHEPAPIEAEARALRSLPAPAPPPTGNENGPDVVSRPANTPQQAEH